MYGPAEFGCPFCDKIAKTKQNMKYHIRTHTGERPFVCKICKLAFSAESSLKRHVLLHTGATFPCEFCDFSAKRKDHLFTHIQKKHPGCL